MELDDFYTNELLMEGRFDSPFQLVNYAIGIAKQRIRTGHVPDLYSDNQNLAYEILDAILEHREHEEAPQQESEEHDDMSEDQGVDREALSNEEKPKPKRARLTLRKARLIKQDETASS